MTIIRLPLQDNVIQGDPPAPLLPPANNNVPAAQQPAGGLGGGLGAAHQAMLQGGGPTGFQVYKRPRLFYFRVSIWACIKNMAVYKAGTSDNSAEYKFG